MMLVCSCMKVINDVDSPSGGNSNDLIGWNIAVEDALDGSGHATKALIESYSDLKEACTEIENHEAEKIGLMGNCTSEGKTEVAFDNVDLWWWVKEDGNPFQDYLGDESNWNYSGDNVLWTDEADYTFKAYFPKSKVELQPGSDAEKLLIVYDTQVSQFDMMVASRSLKSGEENPVKLIFNHALAAVRFDFQFIETGGSDRLTACWLENAGTGGFYTSSTLNYDTSINWPASTPDPVGNRMYYWKPTYPLFVESAKASTAYSSSASAGSGSQYTGNDGWILVIPQTLNGPDALKLCFMTDMGGEEVFSVGLPSKELEAGNRYAFHIKITSTSIDLALTITDWNERKSSHQIDLNE